MRYIHPKDLSADRIVEKIEAHSIAYHELVQILSIACEREGHIWGKELRGWVNCGGTLIEANPNVFCDHTRMEGGEDILVYSRKCSRCGLKQKRDAVVSRRSPFEGK